MRLARRLGGENIYDCRYCEANPHFKAMLGHDGPPSAWWTENLVTNEPLERCPIRTQLLVPPALITEALRYTDSYYPAYQDGHLLVAGGLADQPARYVELIQITRSLDRLVQAKYSELTKDEDTDT